MATYELIAKQILISNSPLVTISSIPATYTDLVVLIAARSSRTNENFDGFNVRFNGSTSNFTRRSIQGDGASVASYSGSNGEIAVIPTATTTSDFGSIELVIPNYASSFNKSYSSNVASISSSGRYFTQAYAGLWANSAAINSIGFNAPTGDLTSGSTFYVYGVNKA